MLALVSEKPCALSRSARYFRRNANQTSPDAYFHLMSQMVNAPTKTTATTMAKSNDGSLIFLLPAYQPIAPTGGA